MIAHAQCIEYYTNVWYLELMGSDDQLAYRSNPNASAENHERVSIYRMDKETPRSL